MTESLEATLQGSRVCQLVNEYLSWDPEVEVCVRLFFWGGGVDSFLMDSSPSPLCLKTPHAPWKSFLQSRVALLEILPMSPRAEVFMFKAYSGALERWLSG